MMEPFTRAEHEEYARRMDDENKRQNKRIDLLEESIKQNQSLTASVEKLAVNMENMLKEQEKQGTRLDSLEARDGEKWRTVTSYVLTTVIGLVVGVIFTLFI